jgi:mevalonate kinase
VVVLTGYLHCEIHALAFFFSGQKSGRDNEVVVITNWLYYRSGCIINEVAYNRFHRNFEEKIRKNKGPFVAAILSF